MPLRRVSCIAFFGIWLVPFTAAAQEATSRVIVQLLERDGAPVVGATFTVGGTVHPVTSDSAGRVVLHIAGATVRLQARAVGYVPLDTTLTIPPDNTQPLVLRMVRAAQQLAPVVTEATLPYGKPLRYQHTGRFDDFYERRAKRAGTFFTREDIERSGRHSVMELMSSVPGVTVGSRPLGEPYIRVARCEANSIRGVKNPKPYAWLAVYINGQRVSDDTNTLTLQELRAADIETVEVYRGSSQLPPEAVGNACAAVFVTTRHTTGSVLPPK